jgi:hypothetical protein
MKTYTEMAGGKFGRAPISVPQTNLCEFIESDKVMYPSLQKSSNLPKTCPIKMVNMTLVIDFLILSDGTV